MERIREGLERHNDEIISGRGGCTHVIMEVEIPATVGEMHAEYRPSITFVLFCLVTSSNTKGLLALSQGSLNAQGTQLAEIEPGLAAYKASLTHCTMSLGSLLIFII